MRLDPHQDTARILNNLAVFYDHQGKDKQAEALDDCALPMREPLLGPFHPDTIICRNSLLTLYNREEQ